MVVTSGRSHRRGRALGRHGSNVPRRTSPDLGRADHWCGIDVDCAPDAYMCCRQVSEDTDRGFLGSLEMCYRRLRFACLSWCALHLLLVGASFPPCDLFESGCWMRETCRHGQVEAASYHPQERVRLTALWWGGASVASGGFRTCPCPNCCFENGMPRLGWVEHRAPTGSWWAFLSAWRRNRSKCTNRIRTSALLIMNHAWATPLAIEFGELDNGRLLLWIRGEKNVPLLRCVGAEVPTKLA